MPDHILVSELYGPVLQGEGALVGKVSNFLRTAGCSYRCTWCDSLHAVDPLKIQRQARRLTDREVIDEVLALPRAPWLTITGGDPAAWDLMAVCFELRFYPNHINIAVETQGSLWHDWLEMADLVTCSPKPPSSGMVDKLDIAMLRKYHARLRERLVFKIVAFDDEDLDFAERLHRGFATVPLYITAGTPVLGLPHQDHLALAIIDGYRTIVEAALKRPGLYDATINCQQHALMYGKELGR